MFTDKVAKRWGQLHRHSSPKSKPGTMRKSRTEPIFHNVEQIEAVQQDREVESDYKAYSRRRTILVKPRRRGYGFCLESYRIYHKSTGDTEIVTFVSNVQYDGPAHIAGMRIGDVIVSVNGMSVSMLEHETIMETFKNAAKNDMGKLRLVVVFEDCITRMNLHKRRMQLQKQLTMKIAELENLELKEVKILRRHSRLPNQYDGTFTSRKGSISSFADLSTIIGATTLSLESDLDWVPSERIIAGNSMFFTNFNFDPSANITRGNRGNRGSLSSLSTSSSFDGIIIDFKNEGREIKPLSTDCDEIDQVTCTSPELKSPDSGFQGFDFSPSNRTSLPLNDKDYMTSFSFDDVTASLMDDELHNNSDDEDTKL
ncbi:uncharacterized protein LOC144355838 [Saccoglossus kowalevskii]